MPSKYCPRCGRINSVTKFEPKYCMWGCGSLEDEPLLPHYTEWENGYYGMCKKAQKDWEERQKRIVVETENVQLSLF